MPENASFCTGCGSGLAPKQEQQTTQQQYTQPIYTAPVYEQHPRQPVYRTQMVDVSKPLTTGQVIGMMLLMCIPVANLILPFVWAFGEGRNLNKKAIGRAILILWLIAFVLAIVFGVAFGAMLVSIFR